MNEKGGTLINMGLDADRASESTFCRGDTPIVPSEKSTTLMRRNIIHRATKYANMGGVGVKVTEYS